MIGTVTRRAVVRALAALPALGAGHIVFANQGPMVPARPPALPADLVALELHPSLAMVPGPHGISLMAHARAGGQQGADVLEYVRAVLARLEQ